MKNKCLIKKHWKFLWFKGVNTYEDHQWVYLCKNKRECKKCHRKELYFGIKYHDTYTEEDWRLTKWL
jgi:hypothetical protein